MKGVKVVGFDADDTLWVNEDYYRDAESEYANILAAYGDADSILSSLYKTELGNLKLYGYGVKPFTISMIQNALAISENKIDPSLIGRMIEIGRNMLEAPVNLLPNVREVLDCLYGKYRLILVTKGDLLDQERKLNDSSLTPYFHHIEIMSDKTLRSYQDLLRHQEMEANEFVMIGNSMRSDILPPYELGCRAIHIPYEKTWLHEMDVEDIGEDERFFRIEKLRDVLQIISC